MLFYVLCLKYVVAQFFWCLQIPFPQLYGKEYILNDNVRCYTYYL